MLVDFILTCPEKWSPILVMGGTREVIAHQGPGQWSIVPKVVRP
jgi:hypothetical protein